MTALVRLLLLGCLLSVLAAMLWAAACGPADFHDDTVELWADEGGGS